jgi:hypothetical protein
MFESEWEIVLKRVVNKLSSEGWEIFIEPYYIQGEETLTLQKNEKYLHLAYGDLEELKTLLKDIYSL